MVVSLRQVQNGICPRYTNMTLTEKIIEFCAEQYPLWVHSGAIERLSMDCGFKAENGGRRAREQAAGNIWRPDGKSVEFAPTLEWKKHGRAGEYRWIPPEHRVGAHYPTPSERKQKELSEKEDAFLAGLRAGRPLLQ